MKDVYRTVYKAVAAQGTRSNSHDAVRVLREDRSSLGLPVPVPSPAEMVRKDIHRKTLPGRIGES